MKIKHVTFRKFKRFRNLTISGLAESIKLVVLVGPNGSGKSSVFEGFNHWYKLHGYHFIGEESFYVKTGETFGLRTNWSENAVELEFWQGALGQQQIHRAFYFRTAYRNEAEFTTNAIERLNDPSEHYRFEKLITSDQSVSDNYQRLASLTFQGVFDEKNEAKTVKELRDEVTGTIGDSLSHIFGDLELCSLGDPLKNGSFYFSKGTSKGFHYKNLSAGEKAAFDLILDMIVKNQYFPQAIYCIDEPESHMHVALQSKLMEELYSLIPDEGQLWIASHSIGMLKKAREIEANHPGTVAFFDFSDRDFDSPVELKPAPIDSTIWRRFMDLAFGDLANLVAPQTIVFCEGSPDANNNRNFDAQIYQRIFHGIVPPPSFVSVGSCTDVENDDHVSMKIIRSVLNHSKIIRLVDRDNRSEQEIADARARGIRVLSRRHIESYLLDDEILEKLCKAHNQEDAVKEVLDIKRHAIQAAVSRGKDETDVKSATGQMIEGFRQRLKLQYAGRTKEAFLRDTIVPLITPDMAVYRELEKDVFGED